jgi:hypothetical protein
MSSAIAEKINLNDLTRAERQTLTRTVYTTPSYFQSLFGRDNLDMACETQSAAFRDEIERLLLERKLIAEPVKLEELHTVLDEEMKTYNFDDGVNKVSTHFYETDEQFLQVYYQFIRHLRENYFREPFWFQATPTIRIHTPHGKNNNHYPRYHSDIGYGHPAEEINLWLPLTEILSGHGFRIMPVAASAAVLKSFDYDFPLFIEAAIHDKEFSRDCDSVSQPVMTEYGKVLAFDSRSVHTGEPLLHHARASMDIRILPLSRYEKMPIEYQGSGRRKILFTPGNCYHASNSDQIK